MATRNYAAIATPRNLGQAIVRKFLQPFQLGDYLPRADTIRVKRRLLL
ncbi:MAG: hypothetical protein V5B33_17645 [Candidatus Accumulibacter sp. UW20]|jgi:hypothetical protein